MKRVINEDDIRKADDAGRCRLLLSIIKGEAAYTQDIKTH